MLIITKSPRDGQMKYRKIESAQQQFRPEYCETDKFTDKQVCCLIKKLSTFLV